MQYIAAAAVVGVACCRQIGTTSYHGKKESVLSGAHGKTFTLFLREGGNQRLLLITILRRLVATAGGPSGHADPQPYRAERTKNLTTTTTTITLTPLRRFFCFVLSPADSDTAAAAAAAAAASAAPAPAPTSAAAATAAVAPAVAAAATADGDDPS